MPDPAFCVILWQTVEDIQLLYALAASYLPRKFCGPPIGPQTIGYSFDSELRANVCLFVDSLGRLDKTLCDLLHTSHCLFASFLFARHSTVF